MGTIGVRELARRTSAILDEIVRKREPTLVTRRGRPIAYVLPIDSEQLEDFVLANAPEFVEGVEAAELELRAGETVSLAEFRRELEDEHGARGRRR